MNNNTALRTTWGKLLCVGLFALLVVSVALTFAMAPVALADEAVANVVVTSKTATPENYTEYSYAGSTFGVAPSFSVPYVLYGDVETFGGASDPITLKLTYGGKVVKDGSGETFTRANYSKFINAAMPAGDYVLTISVAAVETHPALTKDVEFTVKPAALPEAECAALVTALSGKSLKEGNKFAFDWDGSVKLFTPAIQAKIDALSEAVSAATPDRTGTVWASLNDYYGGFALTLNSDAMQSLQYYEVSAVNAKYLPENPGKYVYYYDIVANNFAPLVDESLSHVEYDAARREKAFNVVITRAIAVPADCTATYTGEHLKAAIPESQFYSITDYVGFTEARDYEVVVKLLDNNFYYWEGKSVGETSHTVKFTIKQAENAWRPEAAPTVTWREGQFDALKNDIKGAATFGIPTYVIKSVNSDKVWFDLANNIDRRADMKAGTYTLVASVDETNNYKGLSDEFEIVIAEKGGLPDWAIAVIAVGAALVVVGIFFILWKKGVFQILTGKIVIAIRTNATIDATIAAVRANKMAEEAKKSIAAAKEKDAQESANK